MAIIGAILGDISGSQYEYCKPNNLDYKKCELFTDNCYFTDDTVMTLATKEAIQKEIPFEVSYRKYGKKYPNAGYGGMFDTWLRRSNGKPYNSFGNGSAMRVSYVVDSAKTQEQLIHLATISANCTHNHPEGIKGAVVTAMCGYMAKNRCTKVEIYNYAKSQYPKGSYRYSVEFPIEEYRDKYIWDVTCQGSVPVAIRCFLESEDYESFLRNVYSLPCDMDTLCAIGGGIAEEFYRGTGFDNEYILKRYLNDELYGVVYK